MPDKLTDNEIVKALECSIKNKCPECPYFQSYPCYKCRKMQKDALDLINRLQAENKRLSTLAELGNTRANDYRVMRDRALKAEAEIERLKKHSKEVAENCTIVMKANDKANNQKFLEAIEVVKAEAYKEFAERSKEKAYTYSDITGYQSTVVDVNEIDGVYEELVGEVDG